MIKQNEDDYDVAADDDDCPAHPTDTVVPLQGADLGLGLGGLDTYGAPQPASPQVLYCATSCGENCPQKLKGSFTIFLFFVRTHILDSNEVWYS